jgi:hypothetical protein
MKEAPGKVSDQKRGRRALKFFKTKKSWGPSAFNFQEEDPTGVLASPDFTDILKEFDEISDKTLFPAYATGSVKKRDLVTPGKRLPKVGGHDGSAVDTERTGEVEPLGYSTMGVNWDAKKNIPERRVSGFPRPGGITTPILGEDFNHDSYGQKIEARPNAVVRDDAGKVQYLDRKNDRVSALAEELSAMAPIGPLYAGSTATDALPGHQDSPEEHLSTGFKPEKHIELNVPTEDLQETGAYELFKGNKNPELKLLLRQLGLRPADIPPFYVTLKRVHASNWGPESFYLSLKRAIRRSRARDVAEEMANARPTRVQSDAKVKTCVTSPHETRKTMRNTLLGMK